jgi:hypothetical protein
LKQPSRMHLPVLLAAIAAMGLGGGLALAQTPTETEKPPATAHRVDCSEMPNMSATQARQLKGCYVTELESAPPDATEQEIAEAKAAALCDAIVDPAERPDACSLFATEDGEERR